MWQWAPDLFLRQGSQHAVPYEHRAMAALASSHKRPEWARALLAGYLS